MASANMAEISIHYKYIIFHHDMGKQLSWEHFPVICDTLVKIWPHTRENHMKSFILHKNTRCTIKYERIHTKSCWLGVPTKDDGQKSAIDNKHHLIGQQNFSNSDYFISTTFLCLSIFCCLYLVQDSFMDYLLYVSSNERVAGHHERINHENIHINCVWFSRVCGQAFTQVDCCQLHQTW